MKPVAVKDLKPGTSFNKPVYIDKDNIFVNEGEVLTENDIARLTKWNIKEVYTAGLKNINPLATVEKELLAEQERKDIENVQDLLKQTIRRKNEFKQVFDEAEKILNSVYKDLCNGINAQISPVRSIAERLVNYMNDAPYGFVYGHLYLAKSTHVRHALLSAVYGIYLASILKMSNPRIIEMSTGILLMDVGMLKVPDEVLEKAGSLSDQEKMAIQKHTVLGYQILTQTAKLKGALSNIALEHHEHFDGTGYPQKKKGDQLGDYSRIASIVDSFCAMIETRPYKKNMLPYESIKELLTLGAYRYDARIMKMFLDSIGMYPIGSLLELSDGQICLSAGVIPGKPLRPIVLVIRNTEKERPKSLQFIHLLHHMDKYIVSAKSAKELGVSIESELDLILEKL